MSLHLSSSLSSLGSLGSLASIAGTLVLLAACTTPTVIANSTGGSGGATGSSATTSSGTGAGTTSSGTGASGTGGAGGDTGACAQAGGTCIGGVVADGCQLGVMGNLDTYPCGPSVGAYCCLPCPSPCGALGATQCADDAMQTCTQVGACHTWVTSAACPANEGCNSAGTQCIVTSATCTDDTQCGCGCGCGGGECHCTGAIPPTCNLDSDCGPACYGLVCAAHKCAAKVCTPGMDQTCNANASMNALAGACNPNGTCACKAGFTLQTSGKCG